MSTTTLDRPTTDSYVKRLERTFADAPTKHEAHARSRDLIADASRDPDFLTEAIQRHLTRSGSLNRLHYPVVAFAVESNPHFELVVNCWIPLPDRSTDISTKAIHHHGPMLLTTATAFGPGYDHWMLKRPRPIEGSADLFTMELIDHGRHRLHEVAFVDAYVAHVPIYPESLTITICLWSNRAPTTWRDRVKRIGPLQRHAATLRGLASRAGLAKQLDLKVDDYRDYHPTDRGFVGMKDRDEFPYTNNEDYLYSLFHIIQETGNEQLAGTVEAALARGGSDNPALVRELVDDLRAGRPIEGRLSPGHYGVPFANFTRADIERALAGQPAG